MVHAYMYNVMHAQNAWDQGKQLVREANKHT